MEEKFRNIYNQLIDENEYNLKQAREKVKETSKINTVPIAIMVICAVIAFMGFFITEQTHSAIGVIVGIIALAICFIAIKRIQHIKKEEKDEYNEIYQNKIIKPLMKLFYNEPYVYMPSVGISRDVFEGIEYRRFNIYQSGNLIIGTIKQQYEFKMANVVAILNKYRHFNKRDTTDYDDYRIFNGVLIEIKLPETFDRYLYVKGKKSFLSKELNDISREFKLNKYKINSDEKRDFNIYTSNEEFANKIISKDVISNLLEYSNLETEEYCEMAIRKNYLYLTIPNIEIPGTRVILYEDRESTYQELWNEYKRFNMTFELSQKIIEKLIP